MATTALTPTAGGMMQRRWRDDALRSLASVRTLVLDVSYQPVDVIPWQRAICYELFDKADVIEYYDNHIVRATRYEGRFTDLVREQKTVEVFQK